MMTAVATPATKPCSLSPQALAGVAGNGGDGKRGQGGDQVGFAVMTVEQHVVSFRGFTRSTGSCLGSMPLVLGIRAALGKVSAALGENAATAIG
jgi:hypothetical protein